MKRRVIIATLSLICVLTGSAALAIGPSTTIGTSITTNGSITGTTVTDGVASLSGGALTGLTTALSLTQGGTGATSASTARTSLGLGTAALSAASDFATAAQGALAGTALQSFTELDPVFGASAAHGISGVDIANWNGKLSSESDPVFTAWNRSTGISIANTQVTGLGTAATHDIGFFATAAQGAKADSALQSADLAPYLTIANAGTTYQPLVANLTSWASIAPANKADASALASYALISSLGTAASHDVGYFATAAQGAKADSALQSFTELDPVFGASAAHGISGVDIANWNGKLSSESDPVFTAWNRSTGISIANTQVSDFQAGVSANTDVAHGATAYGWGNHALAGYLTTAAAASAYQPINSYAMFYGLTAGTDNGGPNDYAATVAAGAPVPFPRSGPTSGVITANSDTEFKIPAIGTYEVTFKVQTTEPGQLQLTVDGVPAPGCIGDNATGNGPIVGNCLITTTGINAAVEVVNPAGNSTALTITPASGSMTHANSQTLVIKKL